ncbi:RluA family pseudouridine synthase [Periweissella fabalis]|uniref:Pseudouridine synthase n=1 Tax=Periweissella fabalis TaxID=1070421 RepID=A0A7X6N1W8_9LACO|nr:RluA family pseudouridine synthase [Periweissella fabalis]MCM0598510.1 RluA family pseudouridine synthase [Periweissella fabalis]NKZ24208.1 RluA family pseudouridine synthase [Periweissella fabalis]
MEFTWKKDNDIEQKVKSFLGNHGVSHRMFSQIKHNGGDILVNGVHGRTVDFLKKGDAVTIIMPPELDNDIVATSYGVLDVLYEDRNFLVVNKPAGMTTVPGRADREDTLVNRVKGHLKQQGATDLVPHVVTRLDRFTSGLVLIAKHRFAHAMMDKQLQAHTMNKQYYAVVSGRVPLDHDLIDAPIGRMDDDFIRREVREDGRSSQTEYWVEDRTPDATLVRIQLHTGRTHQIRVHFSHLGYSLLGDDVYGGPIDRGITRQALHAFYLSFEDPFTHRVLEFKAPLPGDMQILLDRK